MRSRATRPWGRRSPGAAPSGCTRMATLSRGFTRMYIWCEVALLAAGRQPLPHGRGSEGQPRPHGRGSERIRARRQAVSRCGRTRPRWALYSTKSGAAEDVAHGAAMALNFLLEHHQGVDQLLGAGRAAGDVDIDGDHLVDRDRGVVVEDAGRGGAGAHGDGSTSPTVQLGSNRFLRTRCFTS